MNDWLILLFIYIWLVIVNASNLNLSIKDSIYVVLNKHKNNTTIICTDNLSFSRLSLWLPQFKKVNALKFKCDIFNLISFNTLNTTVSKCVLSLQYVYIYVNTLVSCIDLSMKWRTRLIDYGRDNGQLLVCYLQEIYLISNFIFQYKKSNLTITLGIYSRFHLIFVH